MAGFDDTILRAAVPSEDRALFDYICGIFSRRRRSRICLTPESFAALFVAIYHSTTAHSEICGAVADATRQLELAELLLVQMSGGSSIEELLPARTQH